MEYFSACLWSFPGKLLTNELALRVGSEAGMPLVHRTLALRFIFPLHAKWHYPNPPNPGIVHGTRIAQAAAVRVELNEPMPGATMEDTSAAYLQVDGEPWEQSIPAGKL